MDMIPRILTQTVKQGLKPGFINLIYGPRQVGKTYLLKQLADVIPGPGVSFSGDYQDDRSALSQTSPAILKGLVDHSQNVYVDEAQRIPNIGLSLKILIDTFPKKNFFVTGSSSLVLSRGIQESLTGRNITYKLYPLSTAELTLNLPPHQKISLLTNQILYGGYPKLLEFPTPQDKQDYLKNIIEDYLLKDVLLLKDVASPENLTKLATLLAFQLGSQVSYNELAKNLNIDVKTIIRYLYLLKHSFVIFELGSYSSNLRKEIAKAKKYYFWDLGIRNALIDQFHPLDVRPDTGQLWENFLAIERIKNQHYSRQSPRYYFWRTYEQAEIDWLEQTGSNISAYEFKWSSKPAKTPKAFRTAYHQEVTTINRDNYLEFIL